MYLLRSGLSVLLLISASGVRAASADSWWPRQAAPATVALCERPADPAALNLAHSLSGLAAQSLNDGTGTEGVWIDTRIPEYEAYYSGLLTRLEVRQSGSFGVWELARHMHKAGTVKGYVLYDLATNPASVNVATVRAGLLKGALVDVSLEKQARKAGLKKLYDASHERWDENTYVQVRGLVNDSLIVLISPGEANNRDYAIAHRSMVYHGVDAMLETVLDGVRPLSPVIGWNRGPEFSHINPCTVRGLINTASDWCNNLPMLTCMKNAPEPGKFSTVDPRSIDYSRPGSYHAFVMSDGDNLQWTMGSFIYSPEYWANPHNTDLRMGFTSCAVNLAMTLPEPLELLRSTQMPGVSVVEYGGGYYYPDLFASKLPDRPAVLRRFAKMVGAQMQRTGTRVFGFICRELDSPAALEAYRIFAEEIEGLAGMVAVQYVPYNGGNGLTLWVKDRRGNDIPVLTARNMVWTNLSLDRSGNPGLVAGCINATARMYPAGALGWTMVHAWSRFDRLPDGSVTDGDQHDKTLTRGVTPLKWGSEMISDTTRVVSIEEVLWRVRMRELPVQTRRIIGLEGTL